MRSAAIRRISAACLLTALAAVNAACDGRAGFSPPDEEAAGVYTGSLAVEVDGAPTLFPLFGTISVNNELQMFSPGGDVHFAGPVTVSQTKFDADLTAFTGEAGGFFGIDGLSRLILDGHMTAQSGANGNFFAPGLQGTFDLTYELVTEAGASLDFTAGTWTYTDGLYTVTFTVDGTGAAIGNDSNGCAFNGQLAIIYSYKNIYDVTLTVSNCGINNGDFVGLAFLASEDGLALDQMMLGVSNDLSAYSVVLDKI